jgi:hypothetical protein
MTDEQINAAIARECGDYICECCKDICKDCAKDYCNDLNAIHEAENHLGESTNMVEYTNALYDMACLAQSLTNRWNPYGLPARYRAEAFLRTLGKWEATTEDSSADGKEAE